MMLSAMLYDACTLTALKRKMRGGEIKMDDKDWTLLLPSRWTQAHNSLAIHHKVAERKKKNRITDSLTHSTVTLALERTCACKRSA